MSTLPTSAEVCEIIKACSTSGVAKLQFGALKIEFSTTTHQQPQHSMAPVTQPVAATIDKDALLDHEVTAKQDQLSTMLLTDPSEYERLMLIGDLNERPDEDAEQDPAA